MQVISFVGYKGGTGKTTLSVHVADQLGRLVPVVLVDTDPQQSAVAWIGGATHLRVEPVAAVGDLDQVLAQVWDGTVVVDGRPGDPALMSVVLRRSNLVVVPLRPSALDVHSNGPILAQLAGDRRGLVVVTQALARSRDAETMRELVTSRYGIKVADTVVHQRVAYQRAPTWQRSVVDLDGAGAAAIEMADLVAEIGMLLEKR